MQKYIRKTLCVLLAALLLTTAAGSGWLAGLKLLRAEAASANELAVYNYCSKTLGLNNAACCGIMGNVEAESNFLPTAVGDGGDAYGICQWNARFDTLVSWCSNNGLDYHTIDAPRSNSTRLRKSSIGIAAEILFLRLPQIGSALL